MSVRGGIAVGPAARFKKSDGAMASLEQCKGGTQSVYPTSNDDNVHLMSLVVCVEHSTMHRCFCAGKSTGVLRKIPQVCYGTCYRQRYRKYHHRNPPDQTVGDGLKVVDTFVPSQMTFYRLNSAKRFVLVFVKEISSKTKWMRGFSP